MRAFRFALLAVVVALVACNNDTPAKPTKSPSPKVAKSPAAGDSPSSSPSASPTASPKAASPTPSPSPTGTAKPASPVPSPTGTGTAQPTASPTTAATATPTASPTTAATATPAQLTVSTVAGTASSGHADGPGASATLSQPSAVVADAAGNLYVADSGNNCIRKLAIAAGVVTVSTYAGDMAGNMGFADAQDPLQARFNFPTGLAIDATGNLYVADSANNRIRMIAPSGGPVSTIAGGATPGAANGNGTAAQFNNPTGLALETTNLYVADKDNHAIRKIVLTPATYPVTTYAGGGSAGLVSGPAADAKFFYPAALAVDGQIIYVVDTLNHRIRKIDAAGVVSTFAGLPDASAATAKGFADGALAAAKFDFTPGGGLALGVDKTLYLTDPNNDRIRAISGTTVRTIAGAVDGGTGRGGFADGAGNVAKFTSPLGLVVLADGTIYVAEQGNNRIRKLK
ncbi:MAG: hypothetical protein JWM80_3089 [Cyanobacteria bacterium RYN_339]|nr:hypothetical protein [Cyanobacteria bacterium RYN_339]